jgi:HAE1 family hydrophobic/amphiphilic exporter-1
MTSLATLAGAAPAVFASGAGQETIRPMGVVVFGGVLVSTVMSLYVCPSWYLALSRFESHRHEKDLKNAMRLLGELPVEKVAA